MNPNAEFERDLARWLQAEAPASAPAGLHAAVIDRARTIGQRPGWATSLPSRWFGRGRGRGMILFAAAALLIVGGAVAAGSGQLRLPAVVPPEPAPSLAVVATPSPAPSATPSVAQPRSASWTATGSMVTPRAGHTATLLPDGKVLVAGGLNRTSGDPNGTILASAELYDPGSGTWTAAGSMRTARESHTATLLPDGKVLVVGGFLVTSGDPSSSTSQHLVSAELYDPLSGTWTATGKMLHGGGTATLLPDGKVLVAGGYSSTVGGGFAPLLATAELYDASTGTWTDASPKRPIDWMPTMATLLPNGRVLMACGCDHAGRASELYDPTSGSWTATGTMVADHWRAAATWLPDGMVTATLLADRTVLVAGGGSATLPSAELYDQGTGSWTVTATMVVVRVDHTATLLADGKVLVAGGEGDPFHTLASAELYDPGGGQ